MSFKIKNKEITKQKIIALEIDIKVKTTKTEDLKVEISRKIMAKYFEN